MLVFDWVNYDNCVRVLTNEEHSDKKGNRRSKRLESFSRERSLKRSCTLSLFSKILFILVQHTTNEKDMYVFCIKKVITSGFLYIYKYNINTFT